MNLDSRSLHVLLDRVRRRWRAIAILTATARAGAAATGLVLAALVATLLLSPGDRLLIALVALDGLGAGGLAIWLLVPALRSPTDVQVARFIEEQVPSLEDRMASAVAGGADTGSRGSRRFQWFERFQRFSVTRSQSLVPLEPSEVPSPFLSLLLSDACSRVEGLTPDRIIGSGVLRRAAGLALISLLCLAVVLFVGRSSAARAVRVATALVFPPTVTFEITPGHVRLPAGRPLQIRARVRGADCCAAPRLQVASRSGSREIAMSAGETTADFTASFDSVDESFEYRVAAGAAWSERFGVTVLHPPRVTRVDLRYSYPRHIGLPPRVEEDSGDIYGPLGTLVGLSIHTDNAVQSGSLVMADGHRIPLASGATKQLNSQLTVSEEGSYRIALQDADGLTSGGDTEYFIRILEDRPPDVRIVRPVGDSLVSPLEEITIQARAADDYGLSQFDLVYSVRGGVEKAVPFSGGRTGLTREGHRTLYLEDLDVKPGDFVAYYARARDLGRGRRSSEARSDLFFLEVKPFEEEFVSAQSQASGGGDRGLDDLAGAQKEIVIATWKLDRRALDGMSGRSAQDIKAVARAQAELKTRVEQASSQMQAALARQRRQQRSLQPGAPDGGPPNDDDLMRAAAAMGRAQTALEALKTKDALPHEMAALDDLMKAQAQNRRSEVTSQRASGAAGGAQRAQRDLSTLFDRELQRQQETNYEMPSQAGAPSPENDALDKLRALAQRQSELRTAQEDLARQRGQMSADELKRQLERLTREQSELRNQTEQLSQRMGQQAGQSGQGQSADSTTNRMREISEQMRSAASELRRDDPERASARSGNALDQLRELERRLSTAQPGGSRKALGDLQLEARQVADQQRQIASDAQQLRAGTSGADGARRLAGEKERLADRTQKLESNARQLAESGQLDPGQRDRLAEAVKELDRQPLSTRMRASAADLRRAWPSSSGQPLRVSADRQAQVEQDLARAADRFAERISSASAGNDADMRKISDDLARMRDVRDRLAEAERDLQRVGAQMDSEQGRASQSGGSPNQADSQSGGRARGTGETPMPKGARAGALEGAREEYARRLREAGELVDRLQRDHGGRGFSSEGQGTTPWVLGDQSYKQDYGRWSELSQQVNVALERLELSLAQQLRDKVGRERVNGNPGAPVPEEYRKLIERYYEGLAKRDRKD